MPSKSDRLDIVKKLAEKKEAAAALNLQKAQNQLDEEQGQYEQVQSYYQEYLLKSNNQNDVSIDQLTSMRGFTHRLSNSVTQINHQISDTQRTIETLQSEWVILRHRRRVLEDLIASAKKEEESQLDKAEQKVMDELVSQQYNRQEDKGNSTLNE
ncbi:MAG: flagellar export protein FliJ [Cellvibrionaceae bacterium]